ncbi:MAG: NAD-dependent epimerase/dehydratase family protein [Syntrophobacteraceae bacterium]
MKSVLVTGSDGFVGSRLCPTMAARGYSVTAAVRRRPETVMGERITVAPVGDIALDADWMPVLQGIDVVIHLAGRAHVLNEASGASLQEFRRVNVEGARRLAEAAARSGVERFVYVSSIKVNGEFTGKSAFTEEDAPAPHGPYAVSKWETERMLRDLSARSAMSVVIVRPPLVYGPGVKGNLLKLMRQIDMGAPLPLAGIDNRRSLIGLDNLVDALELVSTAAAAAGRTFLVSDDQAVSTTSLGHQIATAMGKRARFFRFPRILIPVLSGFSPSLGAVLQRLTESLVVDSSRIRDVLHWVPRHSFQDGVHSMTQAYWKLKRT